MKNKIKESCNCVICVSLIVLNHLVVEEMRKDILSSEREEKTRKGIKGHSMIRYVPK